MSMMEEQEREKIPEKSVVLKSLSELHRELDMLSEKINGGFAKSLNHFMVPELPINPVVGSDKKQESKANRHSIVLQGIVLRVLRLYLIVHSFFHLLYFFYPADSSWFSYSLTHLGT